MKTRLALLGLTAVLLNACSALDSRPATLSYPRPDGPAGVGRTSLLLRDDTRPELFTPEPTDRRELSVQVWYPAKLPQSSRASPWIDGPLARVLSRVTGVPLSIFQSVNVHAVNGAPVAPGPHPVVVMTHGMLDTPLLQTSVAERLASHGFVVLGVTHPYSAAAAILSGDREALALDAANSMVPDAPATSQVEVIRALNAKGERLLKVWTADLTFLAGHLRVLNAADATGGLAGRLDLNRVGVVGHSFGGAAALRAAKMNAMFGAAVNLDGSLFGTPEEFAPPRPVMLVVSDGTPRTLDSLPDDLQSVAGLLAMNTTGNWITHQNATAGSAYVEVAGAKHNNFTDRSLLVRLLPDLKDDGLGSINGPMAQAVTSDLLLTFFQRHLLGKDTALTEVAARHPAVKLDERR